jgi:hypothetical protein
MRNSCQIVVDINMVRAMHGPHKIPFFVSKNKVILAEGLADGSLPTEYFRSVFDFKAKQILHEAPIRYLCVYDFEAQCEDTNDRKNPKTLKANEIIEFPIVIIDLETQTVQDIFQTYVKPTIEPVLTPFTTELTGIT